jgi:hypothetical protein
MATFRQQLTRLFTKFPIDTSRRMNFDQLIVRECLQSFSLPLPTSIKERAIYEKQLIQSIQNQIQMDQLILQRTADEYNTYYLDSMHHFRDMADTYLQNTKHYELISSIDNGNSTLSERQLDEIIASINFAFEELYQKKIISKEYLEKYKINTKLNLQLPYMYFLPEISQV